MTGPDGCYARHGRPAHGCCYASRARPAGRPGRDLGARRGAGTAPPRHPDLRAGLLVGGCSFCLPGRDCVVCRRTVAALAGPGRGSDLAGQRPAGRRGQAGATSAPPAAGAGTRAALTAEGQAAADRRSTLPDRYQRAAARSGGDPGQLLVLVSVCHVQALVSEAREPSGHCGPKRLPSARRRSPARAPGNTLAAARSGSGALRKEGMHSRRHHRPPPLGVRCLHQRGLCAARPSASGPRTGVSARQPLGILAIPPIHARRCDPGRPTAVSIGGAAGPRPHRRARGSLR